MIKSSYNSLEKSKNKKAGEKEIKE